MSTEHEKPIGDNSGNSYKSLIKELIKKIAVLFPIINAWRRRLLLLNILGSTIGTAIAIATFYLGCETNRLADEQNKLLQFEIDKMVTQNHLTEADRRSSMILMVDNVMEAIDREQSEDKELLSPRLIARIGALSHSLKPYYSMGDSSLQDKKYSHERGVLLNLLFNNGYLGNINMVKITDACTFNHLSLTDSKLRNVRGVQVYSDSVPPKPDQREDQLFREYPNRNLDENSKKYVIDYPLKLYCENSLFQNVEFSKCDIDFYCDNSRFEKCDFESDQFIIGTSFKPSRLDFIKCNFLASSFEFHGYNKYFEECFFQDISKGQNENRFKFPGMRTSGSAKFVRCIFKTSIRDAIHKADDYYDCVFDDTLSFQEITQKGRLFSKCIFNQTTEDYELSSPRLSKLPTLDSCLVHKNFLYLMEPQQLSRLKISEISKDEYKRIWLDPLLSMTLGRGKRFEFYLKGNPLVKSVLPQDIESYYLVSSK
jgi:hypothetical protein